MSTVFISYSHEDGAYARRLAASLEDRGLNVWIDERIDYGETWPHAIQSNLDASSVVVVLLTPRAYRSSWVQNEVSRAQRKHKRILPLLLEGEPWLSLEATQYVNVTHGELPDAGFYARVSEALAKANGDPVVESPVPKRARSAQKRVIASILLVLAGTVLWAVLDRPAAQSSPELEEPGAERALQLETVQKKTRLTIGSNTGERSTAPDKRSGGGGSVHFQELEKRLSPSDFEKEEGK